jgi:hypothetical protein
LKKIFIIVKVHIDIEVTLIDEANLLSTDDVVVDSAQL